ncbi:hypothetical protein ASPACDRAFT_55798 [Aspergillus aculeatus ATCC 16872]|uniref:Cucumopine synthase C-terminal helical bundle domain-containing protein n=1 Tax=Aspergillus aculeatus (strain ATCC 16872 / CBS 172.66 / WB 5094) TaxID=690307 RepID=A0A1L9X796_ASPA1|nr:uncharacterized protein ASPACDRAFT_55798 [Aspergillus aculeatus ATCC 16872]OJK04302.1 hypothetical protein ASPACDRAFT_55798 [Aspergillus aculeatus ATCC 16872]
MSTSQLLYFHCPEVALSFRAKLLTAENPDVAAQLVAQLPLQSTLGHVVISGEAFWLPTRIVHLGRDRMVPRHPGAVYLNAVGGSLCLTYGNVTESAPVNKVADVEAADLPALVQLGRLVYEHTVASARHTLLTIHLALHPQTPSTHNLKLTTGNHHHPQEHKYNSSRSFDKPLPLTTPSSQLQTWHTALTTITTATTTIWLHMPPSIQRVKWGLIPSGAGTGAQYFSVLVHLKSFLLHLGCDVLYRLLKISLYPDLPLAVVQRMTREFLVVNFNTFDMLVDLGVDEMGATGEVYLRGVGTVACKEEYRVLTGALFSYVCRMHRWVHLVFPWNLGVAFPQRRVEEILEMAGAVGGFRAGCVGMGMVLEEAVDGVDIQGLEGGVGVGGRVGGKSNAMGVKGVVESVEEAPV